MINISIIVLLTITSRLGFAADVYLKNSRGTVPINSVYGTTIELPRAIREIDKSPYFQIKEIVKKVDEKSRRPIDIKSIHILPKNPGSRDTMTLKIAGGRTLVLRLRGSNGTDTRHRLHLRPPRKTKHVAEITTYLSAKIDLLISMIQDSDLRGFESYSISESLDNMDDKLDDQFDFELTKKYVGADTYGYVVEVENDSDIPQKLKAQWFTAIGGKSVVLGHVSKTILPPCHKSTDENPCTAHLHLVTADTSEKRSVRDPADLPFLLEASK